MSTAVLYTPPPTTLPAKAATRQRRSYSEPVKRYQGRKMTLEEYFAWNPSRLDGWKYEWNQGLLQTYERTIKTEETYLVDNITRLFVATPYFQARGNLFVELNFLLPGKERVRRPDMLYYTKEQITATRTSPSVVPGFIIEVVSTHDNLNEMERKLQDYFDVGVKCVWLIFPEFRHIRAFHSRNDAHIGDLCSATPALPEFTLKVDDVFA